MQEWFARLMSGTDNQTPAIGRYLGALLFIVFLFMLPVAVAVAMWIQHVDWATWEKLLSAMVLYVPAMTTAVVGMIRVLHPTEPNTPNGPGA